MSFGKRVQEKREARGLSQAALAALLGVSQSTVGNYEADISFPKEEVLLRLFDCLETDPNTLFQDSFRAGGEVLSQSERQLLERYRALPPAGRETLRSVSEALCAFRDEMARAPEEEPRVIPLYRSPAAAGYAAPVFGEDFDYLTVQGDVPPAAEFAVRVQGDSMEPCSGTAAWPTSTTTPCGAATPASSAWMGRCSASSTTGTLWAWFTSSP